jgi:hypothetical protein
MHLPDPARLIADLAAADRRLVMVAAGGGALAISHLVTAPGSTGVVLAAEVPAPGPPSTPCSVVPRSRTAHRGPRGGWPSRPGSVPPGWSGRPGRRSWPTGGPWAWP